jgi:hypothetical protein
MPGPLFWSDLRAAIEDPKDSTHPYDNASTEDNFFDFTPEIRLRDDVTLSFGASYRDRHTSSYSDFGAGSYAELMGQLQTYGFTPKAVVSTPLGNLKNVLVLGMDYYRYANTVGSSGASYLGASQSKSDIDKRDFAYYVNEKLYPLPELVLEAGYRRQKSAYDINYRDFVSPALGQVGRSDYDKEAYRLSAAYTIMEKATLFAAFGTGFRFPATDEFVVPGYRWV